MEKCQWVIPVKDLSKAETEQLIRDLDAALFDCDDKRQAAIDGWPK